jgi:hypothetical protein
MTADGATATVTIPRERPLAMRSRGAIYFFAESAKLVRLSKMVVVFENEGSEDGTYQIKGGSGSETIDTPLLYLFLHVAKESK